MASYPTEIRKSRVSDQRDILLCVALGMIAFAMYVRTLLPGLIPNDSAEFQTLAYTLDHAHTTGYHVYLLLAKLFTFLPIGDIAYRVNLFSAFMGGVTVAFTYLAAKTLSASRWGACLAAVTLAVSATVWSQSIIAEVYTAGSAFTAAILWLGLEWNETRKPGTLFLAGLLGGIGYGVHGSVVLAGPAFLVLLWVNKKDWQKFIKPAVGGAFLGMLLLVLAFLLIDVNETNASMMKTYTISISRFNLSPAQIDSPIDRFSFLVMARQWQSMMFIDPATVIPANLSTLLSFIRNDFSISTRLLSLLGIVGLFIKQKKVGWFIVSALAVHLLYTLNYRIGDIYVFFISLYVYGAVLVAEGFTLFQEWLRRLFPSSINLLSPVLGLSLVVFALLPFAGPRIEALKTGELRFDFMGLPSNADLQDWHDIIKINVADLPDNAVVLGGWYDLYAYTYIAQVELDRSDLLFTEGYPFSINPGMAETLINFLQEKINQGIPVYTLERYDELSWAGFSMSQEPVGITSMYRIELR